MPPVALTPQESIKKQKDASPSKFVPSLPTISEDTAASSAGNSESLSSVPSSTSSSPGRNGRRGGRRTLSIAKFVQESVVPVLGQIRSELDGLIAQVPEGTVERANFASEMDSFYELVQRYIQEHHEDSAGGKNGRGEEYWAGLQSPNKNQIIPYRALPMIPEDEIASMRELQRMAVVKLNGGLGTTMGCHGPKSLIQVRDGLSFLDLTVRQVEYVNDLCGCDVPLLLMNSFSTDAETRKIVQKYSRANVQVLPFMQSRFPRLDKDTLLPIATSPALTPETRGAWYPPGHGDIFRSLERSGALRALKDRGIEFLFISNIDNLGATIDCRLLRHFAASGADYLMEVTDKLAADVKGGTLVDDQGTIRLVEIAQVPGRLRGRFTDTRHFRVFNTNNIWVRVSAIERVLSSGSLASLDIIPNGKTLDNGQQVIQLETAVGAAIRFFPKAHAVNVPRTRFLPVKSCSDLLLVQSDLYTVQHGQLCLVPDRIQCEEDSTSAPEDSQVSLLSQSMSAASIASASSSSSSTSSILTAPSGTTVSIPVVKLGSGFKRVAEYTDRFASPPHISELDHLTVSGDVTFGADVTLKGTVIIIASDGAHIDIPEGAVLANRIVSGNLTILDH